jgi:ubiquitin-protein ligase
MCDVLEAELHVAIYFRTLEICISKLKRNWKKILEVTNDECYNGVKFQYTLICILGYTLTKSDKFYSIEMFVIICHFCVA